jgi:hypothetical protein
MVYSTCSAGTEHKSLTRRIPGGYHNLGGRRCSLLDVLTRQQFHERRERTAERFVAECPSS